MKGSEVIRGKGEGGETKVNILSHSFVWMLIALTSYFGNIELVKED